MNEIKWSEVAFPSTNGAFNLRFDIIEKTIWKNLPGESGSTPDIVMRRFDQAPWDMVVVGKEVYLAGGDRVFGWNDIESAINTGNYSFDLNSKTIGSVTFQGVRGIAYNGTLFAVADAGADTIYAVSYTHLTLPTNREV